jgi:hypothetical protein
MTYREVEQIMDSPGVPMECAIFPPAGPNRSALIGEVKRQKFVLLDAIYPKNGSWGELNKLWIGKRHILRVNFCKERGGDWTVAIVQLMYFPSSLEEFLIRVGLKKDFPAQPWPPPVKHSGG